MSSSLSGFATVEVLFHKTLECSPFPSAPRVLPSRLSLFTTCYVFISESVSLLGEHAHSYIYTV